MIERAKRPTGKDTSLIANNFRKSAMNAPKRSHESPDGARWMLHTIVIFEGPVSLPSVAQSGPFCSFAGEGDESLIFQV